MLGMERYAGESRTYPPKEASSAVCLQTPYNIFLKNIEPSLQAPSQSEVK